MSDHVALGLEGVSVRYGRRAALSEVTLELGRGPRTVGLFGPNGAGKTTAIRVLGGLIGRYSGQRIVGRSSTVALLPDAPFLYPWMRLGDAIELFRARYPDFRASVAEAILDVLALSRKVRVGECSKGMSEQLHIALTIARAPDLYLFDEPLASIDPATRIRVIDIIREHRSGSATLLISTHLIDSVSSLFDDIVIIDRGRILLDQSVQAATCYGSLGLEEVYLTAVGAL